MTDSGKRRLDGHRPLFFNFISHNGISHHGTVEFLDADGRCGAYDTVFAYLMAADTPETCRVQVALGGGAWGEWCACAPTPQAEQ